MNAVVAVSKVTVGTIQVLLTALALAVLSGGVCFDLVTAVLYGELADRPAPIAGR